MPKRTWLTIALWFIALGAVPLVWLVGYQDHPWRQYFWAGVVSIALLVAAALLGVRGRKESPPVPMWLGWLAIGMSVISLVALLVWVTIDVGPVPGSH